MKIERLPEYITIVVTVACGMLLALYVGMAAGTGSNTPIMILGGIVAVAIALTLKTKVWILIPLTASLAGTIPGLSRGFGLRHGAIIYAFAVFLGLKALKVVRTKPVHCWIDYLLWLNLAYLTTAYIRNPVGTMEMGFEKIGGRPYIEAIISLLAYWVLKHIIIGPKLAMRMPVIMILGSVFDSLAWIVAMLVPPAGSALSHIYTGFYVAANTSSTSDGDDGGMVRESHLGGGSSVAFALCSYYSPLSLLNPLNIIRYFLFAISLIAIMKTGFRSTLFSVMLFFTLATYFRKGFGAMMRVPAIGLPILAFILVGHGTLFELPLNMQRSLSFLPGKWDEVAKGSAQGSTEWRQQIWSNVWKSGDKYIKNWWFGDGFGMTRRDLQESFMAKFDDSQEALTYSGDYHSLPLSTIHVVGYVGLALLIIQMGGMTYYAWKLIERAKGTPYFPLALFVSTPVVWSLPFGMLIFGAFNSIVYVNILSTAWLTLISRSLDTYLGEEKKRASQPAPFPELEMPRFSRPSLS